MLLQDDPPDSSLSSLPGREFFAVIGFTNFTQPKDSLSPFANEQLLEDGVSSVADGFSSFSFRVLLAPPSTGQFTTRNFGDSVRVSWLALEGHDGYIIKLDESIASIETQI